MLWFFAFLFIVMSGQVWLLPFLFIFALIVMGTKKVT
jgi:hypothetical protein